MDYSKTNIRTETQKRYVVLGKSYRRKCDAIRALAKHELMHEYFDFDEEDKRFTRDNNNKLIPSWKVMCQQIGIESYQEFSSEEEMEKVLEENPQWVCFNYEKWTRLKEERISQIKDKYPHL